MNTIQSNYIFNEKYYLKCLIRNVDNSVKYLDYHKEGLNLYDNSKKNISQNLDINLFTFEHKRNKDIVFDYFLTHNNLSKNFCFGKFYLNALSHCLEEKINNEITVISSIKGGFIVFYQGIKAFVPKRHLRKMINSIKTKNSCLLSTQLFFSNLHELNSLLYPKLSGLMGTASLSLKRTLYKKYQKRTINFQPNHVILHSKNENRKKNSPKVQKYQKFKKPFVRKYRGKKFN